MKIKLYYFGKKSELTRFDQEMIRRIGFRRQIELIPLSQAGIKDPVAAKSKESDLFLSKISSSTSSEQSARKFVVACDERGKTMRSPEFSDWLDAKFIDHRELVFVIGGAHGLDQKIIDRANFLFSFGAMVWTRNLVRSMALEQFYRAGEISAGTGFHKN